jgi:hypothetical protein
MFYTWFSKKEGCFFTWAHIFFFLLAPAPDQPPVKKILGIRKTRFCTSACSGMRVDFNEIFLGVHFIAQLVPVPGVHLWHLPSEHVKRLLPGAHSSNCTARTSFCITCGLQLRAIHCACEYTSNPTRFTIFNSIFAMISMSIVFIWMEITHAHICCQNFFFYNKV